MSAHALPPLFTETLGVFTPEMSGVARSTLRRHRARGIYVPVCGSALVAAGVDITIERRAIGGLLTWSDGVICLRTAAQLRGWPVSDGGDTDILVPNGRRGFGGLVPHHWSVRPTEVVWRGGIRMTDRRTTLADCLGRLPEAEAWGLLAWLWTRDMITLDDLEAQIDERHHLYGVVRLRAMVAAARDGALSMGEVKFHGFLRDRKIVGWEPDQKIGHRGRIVARVDGLFSDLGVVMEFDGAIAHNETTTDKDIARDALLTDTVGLAVVHVTWADMYERARETVRRIQGALEAAMAHAVDGERPYPFLRRNAEGVWQVSGSALKARCPSGARPSWSR